MGARGLEHRPENLAGEPRDLAIHAFGHRESGDAALEAIDVDAHARRASGLLFFQLGEAARRRVERRRAVRLQRH